MARLVAQSSLPAALLLAALVLHTPLCGHSRRNNKGRRAKGHAADRSDVPGLYPLFELKPSSEDQDIMFSDGHTSRIQHLGGRENNQPARAFHIRGLLRQEEAAELITEAQAQPGGPQLSETERGRGGAEVWRNSEQVWVPRAERAQSSTLVRTLNKRTAELTRIPLKVVADGSIQVARYVSCPF